MHHTRPIIGNIKSSTKPENVIPVLVIVNITARRFYMPKAVKGMGQGLSDPISIFTPSTSMFMVHSHTRWDAMGWDALRWNSVSEL